jgi:hypothetical protein
MLDWLGSVRIKRRSATRVELELTRGTILTGWAFVGGGAWLVALQLAWSVTLGVLVAVLGLLLGTLQRRLVFDREDGLLRSEQRVFGIRRRAAIPLFHLRAVVVAARSGGIYVAYVERRAGGTIHLDEARSSAPLLGLANAISEVAELRLVFDAVPHAVAGD